MPPHCFVHVEYKNVPDGVLEGFCLLTDMRMGVCADIDDLIERAFRELLRRGTTMLRGVH
jgi:hypothetical protein